MLATPQIPGNNFISTLPLSAPVASNPFPSEPLLFAEPYQDLFLPWRYKVYYGGRGGAKSWAIARALILLAHNGKEGTCPDCKMYQDQVCGTCHGTGLKMFPYRILCTREFQKSIRDSVHKLLVDQISMMGLSRWFLITQTSIISLRTRSEFIFKGLRHNVNEIKSTEGVDICWVEEAQLVTRESWEILIPTIRKDGSEIWVSFNPEEETDDTYRRFVLNTPPNCALHKVNWDDNPWFPEVLEAERQYMLKIDPEVYDHIWNGNCRIIGDAVIFKNRYVVEAFDTPVYPKPRFLHGLDFGFADDPAALIRAWTSDNYHPQSKKLESQDLWIDNEVYGHGIELDDMPGKFDDGMPEIRRWPIKADSSRPESIRFLVRRGFMVSSADKWDGSIEDGISYLKAFRNIHIHTRCRYMAQEARLYSWKVDKNQLDDRGRPVILPIPLDRHNHCWDALRYALDGYIKRGGGGSNVWARLGRQAA